MTNEIYSALRIAAAAAASSPPPRAQETPNRAEGHQTNRVATLRARTLRETQALVFFKGFRLLGGNLLGTPIDTRDTDAFYNSLQASETQRFNRVLAQARDRILKGETRSAPVDSPSGRFLAARILSGEFQSDPSPLKESPEAQFAREAAEAIQTRYQKILQGIRSKTLATASLTELPSAEARPRESDILGARFSDNPIRTDLRFSLYRRFTLATLPQASLSTPNVPPTLYLSQQPLLKYNDDFEGLSEAETLAKQRELKLSDKELIAHRQRLLTARPTHVLVALSGRYNSYLANFDDFLEQQKREGNFLSRYSNPSGELQLETSPGNVRIFESNPVNGIVPTHILTYEDFLKLRYVAPEQDADSPVHADYLSVVAFKSSDGQPPQARTTARSVFQTLALSTASTGPDIERSTLTIGSQDYIEYKIKIPAEQAARFKTLSITLQGTFPTNSSALTALNNQDLSLDVRQLGRESGNSVNFALLDAAKNTDASGNSIALRFFSPAEGAEDGVQVTLRVKDYAMTDPDKEIALNSLHVRFS